jgi:hypothetical protein
MKLIQKSNQRPKPASFKIILEVVRRGKTRQMARDSLLEGFMSRHRVIHNKIYGLPQTPQTDLKTCYFSPQLAVCHIESTFRNSLFVCGEGPHSRSHGRTAASRLIVQPCDEDD